MKSPVKNDDYTCQVTITFKLYDPNLSLLYRTQNPNEDFKSTIGEKEKEYANLFFNLLKPADNLIGKKISDLEIGFE